MEILEERLRNNFIVGQPYQAYKVIGFITEYVENLLGPNFYTIEFEDSIRAYLHRMDEIGFLKYETQLVFSDTITFLDVDVDLMNDRQRTPLTVS